MRRLYERHRAQASRRAIASGWEPGAGTPNDNLTLFSFTGAALPSVGLFESPLAVCATYDPMALPCQIPDGASSAPGGGIG
jgi:hypothetical protein